jgi:molybdopterin/thiamine biosynthesis adenylyltransferase
MKFLDGVRPRVKPIYPVYRLDETTLRIGAQRGLTTQFRDPHGHLASLLQLADGSRELPELVAAVQAHHPILTATDIEEGLARLDRQGLLDDAGADARAESCLQRYSGNVNHFRHFSRLGDDPWAQQRVLQGSRVTLFGLGGGGSVILPLLVALGVGQIVAVDYDRVDESNLNRQFLYSESDVGELKTTVAERIVGQLNSTVDFSTVNRNILAADDVRELVAGADLAICAIDEPPFLAQRRVNAGCVAAGVTCLFAGSQVTRGRLYTVVPGVSGCFDCLNIHYTLTDPVFEKQFRGFHEIDFDPPTIAFAPDVFRLGASLVAEAARILTGYVPPVSIGTQVELDFLAGSTDSIVEWPRYPDDCPTCGDGVESAWPVFSLYPGTTWRAPVPVGESSR